MIHVTYTDLRNKLAHYLDRALNDKAPILITRQKSEPVVMMAQSEYEGMLETMHLNSSPTNAARLDAAIARLNAGEGIERALIDP
jgi:antitoxin YefM